MSKRTNESFNLNLIGDSFDGKYDMPVIKKQDVSPTGKLIPFNMAKTHVGLNCGVHFYLDDYQFERVWRKPEKYLELLKKYPFVLSPGFSMYLDMPLSMKLWNNYRRQFVGEFWQRNGIKVVPTILWAEERTFQFCFDGIEPGGTISISTQGAAMSKRGREFWFRGMYETMNRLQPKTILHYGKSLDFDFGDTEVVFYENVILKRFEK